MVSDWKLESRKDAASIPNRASGLRLPGSPINY